MNHKVDRHTLELDATTARLLSHCAEMLGVSEQDAVRRALEDHLTIVDWLTERDARVIALWLEGYNHDQIAHELNEDVFQVRYEWQVLLRKLRRMKEKHSRMKTTTSESGRLETFKELQRRLGLTSAKAAEWRNAVHEARR